MRKIKRKAEDSLIVLLGCFFTLLIIALCSALSAFLFMLLWNWLVPLFWTNAPILTFWQSWGVWFLLWLISRLFVKYKG